MHLSTLWTIVNFALNTNKMKCASKTGVFLISELISPQCAGFNSYERICVDWNYDLPIIIISFNLCAFRSKQMRVRLTIREHIIVFLTCCAVNFCKISVKHIISFSHYVLNFSSRAKHTSIMIEKQANSLTVVFELAQFFRALFCHLCVEPWLNMHKSCSLILKCLFTCYYRYVISICGLSILGIIFCRLRLTFVLPWFFTSVHFSVLLTKVASRIVCSWNTVCMIQVYSW